jgi:hypothetical protein
MVHLVILLGAVIAASAIMGAGVYEQVVLDPAWPACPSIVRPAEGGVNRKRIWVPANIVVIVTLLAGVWAAWPLAQARFAAIAALVLFFAINAVTVVFFAPAVLRVERNGVAPNDPASRRWVKLSRLRTPLALGVIVCLAAALLLMAGGAH